MRPKLLLLASACTLLAVLALLRGVARRTQSDAERPGARVAPAASALAAREGSERGRPFAAERSPAASGAVSEPVANAAQFEPLVPGLLDGRVTLDGLPPEPGGRVRLRSGPGGEDLWLPLDSEGRFRAEGVAGTMALTFALPPSAGRTWVLPERTVACTPGASTELVLDWRVRHVNLKVSGDLGGWNRAAVHLEGEGCAAELETDDHGRALLALVASGSYRLVARHPSGRSGSAELELGEEDDLESVVIFLADPSGG